MGTWEACAGAVGRAAVVADGCTGCRLGQAMPAAWIRLGGLFKELVARAPSTPPTSDPGVGAQGPPVTTLQVPMHRWRGAGWSQPDCGGNCVEILFPSPASLSLPVTLGHGKSQSSKYVPCNTQRQAQASVPAPRALQAGATPAALLSPARAILSPTRPGARASQSCVGQKDPGFHFSSAFWSTLWIFRTSKQLFGLCVGLLILATMI